MVRSAKTSLAHDTRVRARRPNKVSTFCWSLGGLIRRRQRVEECRLQPCGEAVKGCRSSLLAKFSGVVADLDGDGGCHGGLASGLDAGDKGGLFAGRHRQAFHGARGFKRGSIPCSGADTIATG